MLNPHFPKIVNIWSHSIVIVMYSNVIFSLCKPWPEECQPISHQAPTTENKRHEGLESDQQYCNDCLEELWQRVNVYSNMVKLFFPACSRMHLISCSWTLRMESLANTSHHRTITLVSVTNPWSHKPNY